MNSEERSCLFNLADVLETQLENGGVERTFASNFYIAMASKIEEHLGLDCSDAIDVALCIKCDIDVEFDRTNPKDN